MRKLIVPALVLLFGCAGAARAQGLSEGDRDALAALSPGSETIALATARLSRSSADISRAADHMSKEESCAMDRELIGLGAALQNASDALKRLEPMLLNQPEADCGVFLKLTPAGQEAIGGHCQRQKAYRDSGARSTPRKRPCELSSMLPT